MPTNFEPIENEPLEEKMSFFDHLEELRRRILYSLLAFAVAFSLSWAYWDPIFDFLAKPMTAALPAGKKLVYLNPTDPFTLSMKVAFLAGVFLASPFIIWQLWLFISPGLYRREKKFAIPFILFSSALFVLGGVFAYQVAFRYTLTFLVSFAKNFEPNITINEYFDFFTVVTIGIGLIFQLPVLILVLSLFGLVTPKFLLKNFQYAVLIIAIVAAVITPTTDIATMLIFMAPMLGLYLLGIPIAYLFGRKKK